MKKANILAMSTALLMILAILAGCSEKPSADPTKDNSKPQSTVSGKETEATTPAEPSVGSVINSKETFLVKAEELLDLSLYDTLYVNEDNSGYRSYSYDIDSDKEKNYALDYAVSLGDGTSLTMPVTLSSLMQNGWKIQGEDPETKLDAGFMTWVALENGSGQTIRVTICNLTENTVAFKDTTVIGMESAQYDSFEPSEKYEDAIDFTVCGSLTNRSTLEEIIQLLGNPTCLGITLWYDDSGTYEYSEIEIQYCQADSIGSELSFVLSGDGDYILSVSYEYRPS